jgi:anti-anti-sigma factor
MKDSRSRSLSGPMNIELEQRTDVCVLRIDGDFITGTDPDCLDTTKAEVKRLKPKKVLIDLTEMPYVGSTGIGFIVALFTTVRVNAGRFVMVGLHPRVQYVFRLTRLDTVIPSSPDVASGLDYLAAGSSQAASQR